jgi:hypothetical protein
MVCHVEFPSLQDQLVSSRGGQSHLSYTISHMTIYFFKKLFCGEASGAVRGKSVEDSFN